MIRGISKPSLEAGLGSSVPTAPSAAVGRRNSSPSTFLGNARAFLFLNERFRPSLAPAPLRGDWGASGGGRGAVLFHIGTRYPVSFPFRPSPRGSRFPGQLPARHSPSGGRQEALLPSKHRGVSGGESGATSIRSVPFAGDSSGPHGRLIPAFLPQLRGPRQLLRPRQLLLCAGSVPLPRALPPDVVSAGPCTLALH